MAGRAPVQIILSGEPQGKGRPRFVRATGHAFTPARTRSYESALRYAAQESMAGATPLDGPLCVIVVAIFPVPASWSAKKRAAALRCEIWPTVKPDADNLLKVMDALNEVAFHDDKQIIDARVVKRYGDRPRLVIEIREYASPAASQTKDEVNRESVATAGDLFQREARAA